MSRNTFSLLRGAMSVPLLAVLVLQSGAAAQNVPPLHRHADEKADKESAKDKPHADMKCPMMSGLAGLRLFADGPAALLARADELGLDVKQRRQLSEIEEAARLQARKVLTDQQWERLSKAPPGRLSMMEMARMAMEGKGMDGCCPMCAGMMRAKEGKAEHKHDHEPQAKPMQGGVDEKEKAKTKD